MGYELHIIEFKNKQVCVMRPQAVPVNWRYPRVPKYKKQAPPKPHDQVKRSRHGQQVGKFWTTAYGWVAILIQISCASSIEPGRIDGTGCDHIDMNIVRRHLPFS